MFRTVIQYKLVLQILRTHDLHNPSDRCPVSNDAIRHLVLIMFKGAAFKASESTNCMHESARSFSAMVKHNGNKFMPTPCDQRYWLMPYRQHKMIRRCTFHGPAVLSIQSPPEPFELCASELTTLETRLTHWWPKAR